MTIRGALIAGLLAGMAATAVLSAGDAPIPPPASPLAEPARRDVVDALLARSRLLGDARFQIPVGIYRQYLIETQQAAPPPADLILPAARYDLSVDKDRAVRLAVRIDLLVLDADKAAWLGLLDAAVAWDEVKIDGQPAVMPAHLGLLRLAPQKAGAHVLTASARLPRSAAAGGRLALAIPSSVQTAVAFDSPGAWAVSADDGFGRLIGDAAGTRGRLALTPRQKLAVAWSPPTSAMQRTPHYMLRGDVAWNLDAGVQQVTADLAVTIAAAASDRVVLNLPAAADRVSVTGPDVRQADARGGRATVDLRGPVLGTTRLRVAFEMPAAGDTRTLSGLGLADGRWFDGTLLVGNSAGDCEVVADKTAGLEEIALSQAPSSAAAILAGPAVLAYHINAGAFSATVESLTLGEFALRQSIADLAHFEAFVSPDGAALCRARYEIRNRSQQFLTLRLPAGATVLAVRVNENSVPLSPIAGEAGAYRVQLERSTASVIGLVSFPVDVAFTQHVELPRPARHRKATLRVPMPRIDLPIAYAWCELFLPGDLRVRTLAGPMRRVEEYSSQTAGASLDYGLGTMAAGYTAANRPTAPEVVRRPTANMPAFDMAIHRDRGVELVAPPNGPVMEEPNAPQVALPSPPAVTQPDQPPATVRGQPDGYANQQDHGVRLPGESDVTRNLDAPPPPVQPGQPTGGPTTPVPSDTQTFTNNNTLDGPGGMQGSQALLARNYWRAGKEAYDRGDLSNATEALGNVVRLAPQSAEADNARRLLANAKVLEGGFEYESKSQKAAGLAVQKEAAVSNAEAFQGQGELLEQAKQELREGKVASAKSKLQAARSMGQKLQTQMGGNAELDLRNKSLAKYSEEIEKSESDEAKKLRMKFDDLRRSGRSEEAFRTGKHLLTLNTADADEVRKEMEVLAVESAGKKPATLQQQPLPVLMQRHAEPVYERDLYSPSRPEDRRVLAPPPMETNLTAIRPSPDQSSSPLRSDGRDAWGNLPQRDREDVVQNRLEAGTPTTLRWARVQGAVGDLLRQAREQINRPGGELSVDNFTQARQWISQAQNTLKANEDVSPAAEFQTRMRELADMERFIDQRQEQWIATQVRRAQQAARQSQQLDIAARTRSGPAEVRTYKLSHADASELADALHNLYKASGAGRGGAAAPEVVFSADPQTNALIVRGDPQQLRDAEMLVRQLDTTSRASALVMKVFPLKNAKAQDVAEALKNSLAKMPSDDARRVSIVADSRTNAIVLSGPTEESARISQLIDQLDRADAGGGGGGGGGGLTYAYDVRDLVQPLTDFRVPLTDRDIAPNAPAVHPGGTPAGGEGDKILADQVRRLVGDNVEFTDGNLVVRGTRQQQEQVRELIGKLREVRGPQVDVNAGRFARQKVEGLVSTDYDKDGVTSDDVKLDATDGSRSQTFSLPRSGLVPAQPGEARNPFRATYGVGFIYDRDFSGAIESSSSKPVDPRLKEFIDRNYEAERVGVVSGVRIKWRRGETSHIRGGPIDYWPVESSTAGGSTGTAGMMNMNTGPRDEAARLGWDAYSRPDLSNVSGLVERLRDNLGQKVVVNSLNLNVDPRAARSLGADFDTPVNGAAVAVIDEAQFRALRELDVNGKARGSAVVGPNGRMQETIVGTDASLANGMAANEAYAGEGYNDFLLGDARVRLDHAKYLLIDNGGYLTVMRAGPMQHWTEPPADVRFPDAPLVIEVPRQGETYRLEKTLMTPQDDPAVIVEFEMEN
ncbi:MAG: hypothetical protein BIFFINMI_01035 [Phycisphaerae bacterium]|nr:hypothetical protein [Phycisphaerae bacterium]